MSRKPTPPPEGRFIGGGGLAVLALAIAAVLQLLVFDSWWVLISAIPLTIPLLLYVGYLIYSVLLLLAAWWRWRWRWRDTPVRGILVFSDSPNWQEYIEREWIPRLVERVVVLNWSKRRSWPRSLEVRLFDQYGMRRDNRNFNPLLIYFRGIRYPLVYRFWSAFRDAKHGHPEALQQLEQAMFARLES